MGNVDIQVRNEGTIYLFTPITNVGSEWIAENVEEPLWFGDSIACEHRFARDLAFAMEEDGLIVC